MSQTWTNLSNCASITGIADVTISKGWELVQIVQKAIDSEETVARIKSEIMPQRSILIKLQDKLQSSNNIPLQRDISLACSGSQLALDKIQKNIESWVGDEQNHSLRSSLNIAFRDAQLSADMAQLSNWRGVIELAMSSSILVQGERQTMEITHLEAQVNKMFQSVNEQMIVIENTIGNALKEKSSVSKEFLEALKTQKESAEALKKLCMGITDKVAEVQASFGTINSSGRAALYTGIVENVSGPVRHTHGDITVKDHAIGFHSIIGASDAVVKLAEMHYNNRGQAHYSEDIEPRSKSQYM